MTSTVPEVKKQQVNRFRTTLPKAITCTHVKKLEMLREKQRTKEKMEEEKAKRQIEREERRIKRKKLK